MTAPRPEELRALAEAFWAERDETGAMLVEVSIEPGFPRSAWDLLDSCIDTTEDAWLVVDALIVTVPDVGRLRLVGVFILTDVPALLDFEAVDDVLASIRVKHGDELLSMIATGLPFDRAF